MGLLRRVDEETVVPLATRSLAGRSAQCTVTLADKFASSEHARISWSGQRWTIRDLGSRNGTFVNQERLEPGAARELVLGDEIGFGDPAPGWRMVSQDPPAAIATNLSDNTVRWDEHLLVIPNEEDPRLSVYRDRRGRWVLEAQSSELRPLSSEEVIVDLGVAWRLQLPDAIDETPMVDVALNLETATLKMVVTRDEEHVDLTLDVRGIETPLERREHWYLLLTLARARREDEGRPIEERGWRSIDELTRMLRMDPNALNVAIHRARQQLGKAGVDGAAGVVEVRRGSRRLGTERFRIERAPD